MSVLGKVFARIINGCMAVHVVTAWLLGWMWLGGYDIDTLPMALELARVKKTVFGETAARRQGDHRHVFPGRLDWLCLG